MSHREKRKLARRMLTRAERKRERYVDKNGRRFKQRTPLFESVAWGIRSSARARKA